jgi:hypothetical protein
VFAPPKPKRSTSEAETFDNSGKNLRQLTVYCNVVQLAASQPQTAMILPVPVSHSSRSTDPVNCGIVVHDMQAASTGFFDKLREVVDECRITDGMCGFGATTCADTTREPLEVRRAGVYRYSIVPTLPDFSRVDNSVFKLEVGSILYELLAAEYSGRLDFAFLVCVIDETATLRPIAYEHDRLEGGNLFVPTRHYHPHESSEKAADSSAATPTAEYWAVRQARKHRHNHQVSCPSRHLFSTV